MDRMTRRGALVTTGAALLFTAVAVILVPARPDTARAATQTVQLGNNFYSPTAITIDAGDTIEWDWPAAPNPVPHTVTSDSGSELASPQQATGTYSHTFASAGTFAYHCEVHPTEMKGTITVNGPPTATSTAAATNTPPATNTAASTSTRTPTQTGTPAATGTTAPSTRAPTAAAVVIAEAPPTQGAGGVVGARQLPGTGDGSSGEASTVGWRSIVAVVVLGGFTAAGARRLGAHDSGRH